MKKMAIIFLLFFVSGCYSFGRGFASRVMEDLRSEDTRQCEIRGNQFNGITSYFGDGEVVKVFIVHGIGTHRPGHSAIISESIARSLGLNVFSNPANFTIMNPANPGQRLANLRIIKIRSADASRKIIFYELTWSEITAERKRALDFDTSGEFAHRRAPFNNAVKVFLNDVSPDPIFYLVDEEKLILSATLQAICWMLADEEGGELENNQNQVCSVSSLSRLSNLEKDNIVFITHSLGSRIIMDALGEIVETLTSDATLKNHPELIAKLQEKEMTVFMLSNQLPLLQIVLPPPTVVGQIDGYCREDGEYHHLRAFKKLEIVSITDPNDLLSYSITQDFVDRYFDSRMCPELTNIKINVADRIAAFGAEVVNPMSAHGNYHSDARVIELIAHGNADFEQNALLSERCRMIRVGNQQRP